MESAPGFCRFKSIQRCAAIPGRLSRYIWIHLGPMLWIFKYFRRKI
jgi:hypothetical protein